MLNVICSFSFPVWEHGEIICLIKTAEKKKWQVFTSVGSGFYSSISLSSSILCGRNFPSIISALFRVSKVWHSALIFFTIFLIMQNIHLQTYNQFERLLSFCLDVKSAMKWSGSFFILPDITELYMLPFSSAISHLIEGTWKILMVTGLLNHLYMIR